MPPKRKATWCHLHKRLQGFPANYFVNTIGRVRGGLEVPPPPVATDVNQAPKSVSHDDSATPYSIYSATHAIVHQPPQSQISANNSAPTILPTQNYPHSTQSYGYFPPTVDDTQNYSPQQWQGTGPSIQLYYQGNVMAFMGGSPDGNVNNYIPYSVDLYNTRPAFFDPYSASGLAINPGVYDIAPPNTGHYPQDSPFGGDFSLEDPHQLGFANPKILRSSAYIYRDDIPGETWGSTESADHIESARLRNIQV